MLFDFDNGAECSYCGSAFSGYRSCAACRLKKPYSADEAADSDTPEESEVFETIWGDVETADCSDGGDRR